MGHPDEDELTALALGTLPGEPAELLRHLTVCATCRTAYDDLSAAVDAVLPAAPAVAVRLARLPPERLGELLPADAKCTDGIRRLAAPCRVPGAGCEE